MAGRKRSSTVNPVRANYSNRGVSGLRPPPVRHFEPLRLRSADRSKSRPLSFFVDVSTMTKLTQPRFFPPPELAEPEGVVLFGGQLTPRLAAGRLRPRNFSLANLSRDRHHGLVVARSAGHFRIFRFAGSAAGCGEPCRAAGSKFRSTAISPQVIHACATAGDRRGNTWITPA